MFATSCCQLRLWQYQHARTQRDDFSDLLLYLFVENSSIWMLDQAVQHSLPVFFGRYICYNRAVPVTCLTLVHFVWGVEALAVGTQFALFALTKTTATHR